MDEFNLPFSTVTVESGSAYPEIVKSCPGSTGSGDTIIEGGTLILLKADVLAPVTVKEVLKTEDRTSLESSP
jgi:hypothetical protein